MNTVKIKAVKKEIESLSAELSAGDAQQIFHAIVFKKQVQEGIKDADNGDLTEWNDFKKEIRSWYKSK